MWHRLMIAPPRTEAGGGGPALRKSWGTSVLTWMSTKEVSHFYDLPGSDLDVGLNDIKYISFGGVSNYEMGAPYQCYMLEAMFRF